jgi:uncharacterized protein YuzE
MRATDDAKVDAVYIDFADESAPGDVARTHACDPREVKGQICLDFDSEGRLLGIEVPDAKAKLPESLLKGARLL